MGRYKLLEEPEMSNFASANEDAPESNDIHNVPHLEIVSRVSKLPVVESAIFYAGDSYGRVKNAGPAPIQKSVSWAEALFAKMIGIVLAATLPFVKKFEGQVNTLDSLACTTFDKVTEKVPLITQPPEKIVTSTRSYLSETMTPFQNVSTSLTNRILQNSLAQFALEKVRTTKDKANTMFDYYVPPTVEEAKAGDSHDLRTKVWWIFKRIVLLMTSIRTRLTTRPPVEDKPQESSGTVPKEKTTTNEAITASKVTVIPEKPLNIFLALAIRMADLLREPLGLNFQSVPKLDKMNGSASRRNGSLISQSNGHSSASEDGAKVTNKQEKVNGQSRANDQTIVSHF